MLLKKTLAAAAATMITIGAMAGTADAASMTMKPVLHHMLVCKPGSVAHLVKVKVHGKWHKVWRCHRIHHKLHIKLPKPGKPKAY